MLSTAFYNIIDSWLVKGSFFPLILGHPESYINICIFGWLSLAVTDEITLMHHQVKEHGHKYQCGDCGELFSNREYAKKHMLTHSTYKRKKAKKSNICWICDYNAPGPLRLSQHILQHYKKIKPKWRRKIKFFNCRFCSFSTIRSDVLKKHVKNHCPKRKVILDPATITFEDIWSLGKTLKKINLLCL